MLDKFIFENHLGQRFDGLANGVYLNYCDLRDYMWEYETINNRISRFYRPVTSRNLPLVFYGETDKKAIEAKNRLLELAEADIEAMLPGKIYVGEYYTTGFITASTKKNYLISKRYGEFDLTFTSNDPAWFREQTYIFLPTEDAGEALIGAAIDYPFEYKYDYAVTTKTRQIVFDGVRHNRVKIRIYGEANNPTITIGNHIYTVNGMVRAGEKLLVDGVNKTITLTTTSGAKVNWFDRRSRESYIFEPIPSGINDVRFNGTFGFDLTVIEERSEPKWI